MPGDRLIAECIYDSSSRKAITLGKCSGSTYTWVYVHRAAQKKALPTQTAIKIAKNPVNCGRRGRSQHCRERKCSMKLPMALGRKQAVGVESEGGCVNRQWQRRAIVVMTHLNQPNDMRQARSEETDTRANRCTRRPKTKAPATLLRRRRSSGSPRRRQSSHVTAKYINQDSETFHLAHGRGGRQVLQWVPCCPGPAPAPVVTAAQDSNEMDNAVQWLGGVWIEVVINEIGIVEDGKM